MDALFTATSAVCVTGLTVVNTGLVFTLFGKLVILSLIQIGGLGFMTIASILFMVVGKRISLKERLLIQESFNTDSLQAWCAWCATPWRLPSRWRGLRP